MCRYKAGEHWTNRYKTSKYRTDGYKVYKL